MLTDDLTSEEQGVLTPLLTDQYVHFYRLYVTLDGSFTMEELQAILDVLRRREAAGIVNP